MTQTIAALTSLRDSAAKSLADATCPFQAAGYSVMVTALNDAIGRLDRPGKIMVGLPGFGSLGVFTLDGDSNVLTVSSEVATALAEHFRAGGDATRFSIRNLINMAKERKVGVFPRFVTFPCEGVGVVTFDLDAVELPGDNSVSHDVPDAEALKQFFKVVYESQCFVTNKEAIEGEELFDLLAQASVGLLVNAPR